MAVPLWYQHNPQRDHQFQPATFSPWISEGSMLKRAKDLEYSSEEIRMGGWENILVTPKGVLFYRLLKESVY